MNLYQELNKSLRDFKTKESLALKESEEVVEETVVTKKVPTEPVVKEVITESDDIETPTEEDLVEDTNESIRKQIEELNNDLASLSEGLDTTEDPEEKEKITSEINEIKTQLSDLESSLVTDSEEVTESLEVPITENEDEVTEETTEEVTEVDNDCPECNDILSDIQVLITKATEEELPEFVTALTGIANKLKGDDHEEETTEEVEEIEECDKSDLVECEVNAIRVLRISPSTKTYMIEADTAEGLKYIVGRNYSNESKVLDEAEQFDDKSAASEHFKTLLK